MKKDVSAIFNKFAGREVEVKEVTIHCGSGRSPYHTITECNFAHNPEPLVQEMEKTASDNGLTLRVWLPGIVGTMDYRTDRVNAHIEKETDGKYRVSSRFNIG